MKKHANECLTDSQCAALEENNRWDREVLAGRTAEHQNYLAADAGRERAIRKRVAQNEERIRRARQRWALVPAGFWGTTLPEVPSV